MSLTNIAGQLVYVRDLEVGQKTIAVNSNFLLKGIYIISVKFVDKSTYSDRLIVR